MASVDGGWPHSHLRRASIMSGFPTDRWGTPRSDTPISAPGGSSCRICRGSMRRSRRASSARMPALRDFIARLKATGGTAHLMGLLSPGGVHSHQRADRRACAHPRRGRRAGRHACLSRRPRHAAASAARSYLEKFQGDLAALANVRSRPSAAAITRWIATSAGIGSRNAYRAIVDGEGEAAPTRRGCRGRLSARRNR